jgi:glyoxylase-like metal-dependent hydrolase (beta-lactamase superfamily II)
MNNLKLLIFVTLIILVLGAMICACTKQEPIPSLPTPSTSTAQLPTPAISSPELKHAEIYPGVTPIDVLNGLNYVYLIKGGKIAIIDTGPMNSTGRFINPALKKLGINATDLDYILNTCIHWDHTGGDYALQAVSHAQIGIYAGVADYLENPELAFEEQVEQNVEAILGKEYIAERRAQYLNQAPPGVTVKLRLNEGDVIKLGQDLDLKVLYLPGHTLGDMGFYLEAEGLLFAGGSVCGVHGVLGELPVIDDIDAYEKTLERLKELPLKQLALTHPSESITMPSTNILRDEDINRYLNELLDTIPIMRQAATKIAPTFSETPFWECYDEFVSSLPDEWGLKPSSEMAQVPFYGGVTFLNLMKKVTN